jgi:hypothetical protein
MPPFISCSNMQATPSNATPSTVPIGTRMGEGPVMISRC